MSTTTIQSNLPETSRVNTAEAATLFVFVLSVACGGDPTGSRPVSDNILLVLVVDEFFVIGSAHGDK